MGAMERSTSFESAADESGYSSASSSEESLPEIVFTKAHLAFLNTQLSKMSAEDVLRWTLTSLPGLYQTTAFGLTGLVTIDMLSKIHAASPYLPPTDLIFLDTLHHFSETHDLVNAVRDRYPNLRINVFRPHSASTADEFAAKYGAELWKTDPDRYDYLAKVEPAQRAYAQLKVQAVLTGRRRSQGGKRGELNVLEIDDAGLVKVNPLASWSFADVKRYIDEHNVPYNALLDRGYKSVGDWHSTEPVAAGEDERSGRWKGQEKTECGIHNKRSKYAMFLQQQALLAAAEAPVILEDEEEGTPKASETVVENVQGKESVSYLDSQDSAIDLVDVLRTKLEEAKLEAAPSPAPAPIAA